MSNPDSTAYHLARVGEVIARCGHLVQGVFPSADDPPGTPAFAYTVGLLDRLGAEYLLFCGGMDRATTQGILNTLAELGTTETGVRVPGVVSPPYTVMLLATDSDRAEAAGYPPTVARAWHARPSLPLRQVVWQDVAYRWPWHRGYSGSAQPVLGDPPPPDAP